MCYQEEQTILSASTRAHHYALQYFYSIRTHTTTTRSTNNPNMEEDVWLMNKHGRYLQHSYYHPTGTTISLFALLATYYSIPNYYYYSNYKAKNNLYLNSSTEEKKTSWEIRIEELLVRLPIFRLPSWHLRVRYRDARAIGCSRRQVRCLVDSVRLFQLYFLLLVPMDCEILGAPLQ
jgi:hypothetical protein